MIKKNTEFKLKNDSYTKRRGTPTMLIIACSGCNTYLMHYQKDGPGPLLRCYLDRIHYPEQLNSLQHIEFNKKSTPKLECSSCGIVIGIPFIYEKENLPAYHMRSGLFSRKKM